MTKTSSKQRCPRRENSIAWRKYTSLLASDKSRHYFGGKANLNKQVFNCCLNPVILSLVLMALGNLFHSVGEAIAKLRNSMGLFGLAEETERRLSLVRSLCLIKVDRYGGLLKFIAM